MRNKNGIVLSERTVRYYDDILWRRVNISIRQFLTETMGIYAINSRFTQYKNATLIEFLHMNGTSSARDSTETRMLVLTQKGEEAWNI